MKEMNREMELSMDELEQVSGGMFCWGWGVATESVIEAQGCLLNGSTAEVGKYPNGNKDEKHGGCAACLYLFGIGLAC